MKYNLVKHSFLLLILLNGHMQLTAAEASSEQIEGRPDKTVCNGCGLTFTVLPDAMVSHAMLMHQEMPSQAVLDTMCLCYDQSCTGIFSDKNSRMQHQAAIVVQGGAAGKWLKTMHSLLLSYRKSQEKDSVRKWHADNDRLLQNVQEQNVKQKLLMGLIGSQYQQSMASISSLISSQQVYNDDDLSKQMSELIQETQQALRSKVELTSDSDLVQRFDDLQSQFKQRKIDAIARAQECLANIERQEEVQQLSLHEIAQYRGELQRYDKLSQLITIIDQSEGTRPFSRDYVFGGLDKNV